MKLRADGLLLRLFFACALAALAHAAALAQNHTVQVDKIEPPSWWAGHTINPVRLLVRGSNLQHVNVLAETGSPFKVSGQTVNARGTYLFVDLQIDPAARPGEYNLTFYSGPRSEHVPFRINAPLDPSTHFQ